MAKIDVQPPHKLFDSSLRYLFLRYRRAQLNLKNVFPKSLKCETLESR